jgi:hypothetical protein
MRGLFPNFALAALPSFKDNTGEEVVMPITHLAGTVAIHSLASFAIYQLEESKLLMIFIGIVAFAMLTQAIVTVGLGIAAFKAQRKLLGHLEEFKAKALPLIDKSHALVVELGPQVHKIAATVETITEHVERIAAVVHAKTDEIAPTVTAANLTVQDANLKARAQVSRVDHMVSSVLDATVRLGVAIEQGIARPSREIAGVLSGFRAGFDTLIRGARAFGSGAKPKQPPFYPGKSDFEI